MMRSRLLSASLLAALSGLGACGDDDGTGPMPDSGVDGGSPRLSFARPRPGAEVSGLVRVEVEHDQPAPALIDLYVDGEDETHRVASAVPSAGGATMAWYTGEVANGPHTLFASADGYPERASVEVTVANRSRADSIPADAVKMTPDDDQHPPELWPDFAMVFAPCEPVGEPMNTAGAEDSPYITADGEDFYLFFTPDTRVPAERQLGDLVTGIYRSRRLGDGWSEPERVWLAWDDELALDGCETVTATTMWFCSARVGGLGMWTAELAGGRWSDWQRVPQALQDYEVGELHVSAAGDEIFFDSARDGGAGQKDIWVTRREGDEWQPPTNVTAVNTTDGEGWPWLSPDGSELWFTRTNPGPFVLRSTRVDGEWQEPEGVVSPFAGEPTFDGDGNLYFTHHYWDDADDRMIEADIYVCRRK